MWPTTRNSRLISRSIGAESDRLKIEDIGLTAEGRHQYMAIITSPANHKNLEHYKDISRRLALADGLTDDQAHALAREGKAVIYMDRGLHATETVGAQSLIEMVYQLASRTDPETMRFLNDDIILLVLANPDGMELVSNWYMREPDETKRSLNGLPRLWQKYIGHDNARDMFMSNMPETININRVLYSEWFPQITHTHHQTGPAGAVVFMPPFRDPFNYNFDPLVIEELEPGGRGHAQPPDFRGQCPARRARRGQLLHLVQRRRADHQLFPQHGRIVDRDHRQPHSDGDSAGARPPVAEWKRAVSYRAADLAFSPLDRLRNGVHPRRV